MDEFTRSRPGALLENARRARGVWTHPSVGSGTVARRDETVDANDPRRMIGLSVSRSSARRAEVQLEPGSGSARLRAWRVTAARARSDSCTFVSVCVPGREIAAAPRWSRPARWHKRGPRD